MFQASRAAWRARLRIEAAVVLITLIAMVAVPATARAATGDGHGVDHRAGAGHRTARSAVDPTPSGKPKYRDPWAIPGPAVFFECDNTHRSNNDPIVYPRRPGQSHRHVFFGSRRSNAFSTLKSLLAGRSGCDDGRNTSAYWFPEPRLPNGRRATIWNRARVYYMKAGLRRVKPIPHGLRMIAGSMDDALVPGEAGFVCRPVKRPGRNGMPTGGRRRTRCPKGSNLGVSVVFPNCWNGRDLDAPDHRSHMRYAKGRTCPKGWVPLPQIRVSVSTFKGTWRGHLASGGPRSIHADVIAAPQPGLMRDVVGCLNGTRGCPKNSFGL